MRTQQIRPGMNERERACLSCLCRKATALRNTGNFYIRNLMTGLKKEPSDRTSRENEVLANVAEGIRRANDSKHRAFDKKARKLLCTDMPGLCRHGEMHAALAKAEPYRMLTADEWFPGYELLDAVFRELDIPSYRALPAQVNQNCLRLTVKSWKSYFELLKRYKEDPDRFNGKPGIPGYIRGESTCWLTNQRAVLIETASGAAIALPDDGPVIRIGPYTGKYVKTEVKPCFGGYTVCVTFDDGTAYPEVPEHPGRIIGIDTGVNNFLAVANNFNGRPFLVKGGFLKSWNRWFNKHRAWLVSACTNGGTAYQETAALDALSCKRYYRIRDFFYKAAHFVCRYGDTHKAEVILVSHNDGQKNKTAFGSDSDRQNFVSIPYLMFIGILKDVAAKYGIAVLSREESYTSIASFVDMDMIPTYGDKDIPEFSGKRVKRGLYKAADGRLINADINGAANLIRKQYPYAFDGQDVSYLIKSVDVVNASDLYPDMPRAKKESVRISKVGYLKPKYHLPSTSSMFSHRERSNRRADLMSAFGLRPKKNHQDSILAA